MSQICVQRRGIWLGIVRRVSGENLCSECLCGFSRHKARWRKATGAQVPCVASCEASGTGCEEEDESVRTN